MKSERAAFPGRDWKSRFGLRLREGEGGGGLRVNCVGMISAEAKVASGSGAPSEGTLAAAEDSVSTCAVTNSTIYCRRENPRDARHSIHPSTVVVRGILWRLTLRWTRSLRRRITRVAFSNAKQRRHSELEKCRIFFFFRERGRVWV